MKFGQGCAGSGGHACAHHDEACDGTRWHAHPDYQANHIVARKRCRRNWRDDEAAAVEWPAHGATTPEGSDPAIAAATVGAGLGARREQFLHAQVAVPAARMSSVRQSGRLR
jgi:hypothetical protein